MVFPLALRAAEAGRAVVFTLDVRAAEVGRAVVFTLAERAVEAGRAVVFTLAERAADAVRAVSFCLPCLHRFWPPITCGRSPPVPLARATTALESKSRGFSSASFEEAMVDVEVDRCICIDETSASNVN